MVAKAVLPDKLAVWRNASPPTTALTAASRSLVPEPCGLMPDTAAVAPPPPATAALPPPPLLAIAAHSFTTCCASLVLTAMPSPVGTATPLSAPAA